MGGFGMADKKQFDGSETSKKSKSLLFSLAGKAGVHRRGGDIG